MTRLSTVCRWGVIIQVGASRRFTTRHVRTKRKCSPGADESLFRLSGKVFSPRDGRDREELLRSGPTPFPRTTLWSGLGRNAA